MKFGAAFILSVLTYIFSPLALTQDASLNQCKRWAEKAEYYKYLRRKGGSGYEMDYWKRKVRDYEDKFREYKCRKYGKRLN